MGLAPVRGARILKVACRDSLPCCGATADIRERDNPLVSELRDVFIQGVTRDGKPFRPSDWAERLAGAMCSFRPGAAGSGYASFIGYSPYCVPRVIEGVKCVIVSEALRDLEPMAWDFVMNFARDNELVVAERADPGAPRPK
jgi:hypothetical protein